MVSNLHTPSVMLHIHLFGHLRIFVDQQSLRLTILPKTTSLLAYLLLHAHTAVPRERLAFLLWNDITETEARANLRRHLYDLRQALPPTHQWVLSDSKTVRWNQEAPFWLDTAQFQQLCTDINHLAEATTLYMGDLLPELYDDWLLPERARFQALYTTAVKQLVSRERARGDLLQAIAYTRQLLTRDPLQEDVVRELMTMQHEHGDRAGAMKLYQQFVQRLQEELDVAPMPETTAVYEAIRTGGPTATHTASQPTAVPHNLPAQLTSFVGRHDELQQIISRFTQPPHTRLLTITGTGGTGKTRLALEIAYHLYHHHPHHFPDGIFFIGLASITNPDFVATAVAETISQPQPALTFADLKNQLRHKKMLLILDNFEHLLPAASIVSELLTAVANLHILVTSQSLLHLYGEYEYPLPPLPLPNPNALPPLADYMQYAAIALFVERLQAVNHTFVLTEENGRDVAAICTCLDGIPLALELAAGRGKLFTPDVMLQQLSSRLRFLQGQSRNLPSRHQTLRASIDWSYHLLQPAEQQLFVGLSLFASSFTTTAVYAILGEWVADETTIDHILHSLIDKNMVRILPIPNEPPRFRLLQTLREYGQEKLTEDSRLPTICQRWVAYYTDWSTQFELGLRTNAQTSWLRQQTYEDANLLAVLNWLLDSLHIPAHGRAFAQIINSQESFWTMQGRLHEAKIWFDRALTCQPYLTQAEQIRLLNKAGVIAQHLGNYDQAAPLHAQALQLAYQDDNRQSLADTLHYLGFAAGRQGHYQESRRLLEESLALYRQLPDTQAQISTLLNNLAIVYRRQEQYDDAIAILEESLAIKQQLDDKLGAQAALVNLSLLLAFKGDFAQAQTFTRQSLRVRYDLQDLPGLVVSIGQLAELATEMGDAVRAVTLIAATVQQRQQIHLPPTPHVQAEIDQAIANLRQQLGDEPFQQAWNQGIQMTMEQVVAFALEERPSTAVDM